MTFILIDDKDHRRAMVVENNCRSGTVFAPQNGMRYDLIAVMDVHVHGFFFFI